MKPRQTDGGRALAGRRIVVTAGPTRESLDPVRFLSNASSGEMGIRVAEALAAKGASVTLVLGPTSLPSPKKIRTRRVVSAREMNRAVQKELRHAHAFVATAAVCDWRFEKTFLSKKKKGSARTERVTLVRTPDILASAAEMKRRRPTLRLIGFALETGNMVRNAEEKLRRKRLNLIIGNDPSSFSAGRIRPLWIEAGRAPQRFSSMSKAALSRKIAFWLAKDFRRRIG